MHTQPPMYARTTQTNKDPELWGRPLRRGGPAVAAPVILIGFLDLEELRGMLVKLRKGKKGGGKRKRENYLRSSLWIYLPHRLACHPASYTVR
jgi:hypothetical protein